MTFFHLRIFIYPEYTMIFRVIPIYAYKNRLCVKYVRFAVSDVFGAKRESEGVYNPTSGQV